MVDNEFNYLSLFSLQELQVNLVFLEATKDKDEKMINIIQSVVTIKLDHEQRGKFFF